MLSRVQDITGGQFGMLTALSFDHTRSSGAYWRFRCDCGTEKVVSANAAKRGETRSCGCHRRAVSGRLNLRHGESDQRKHRLYRIWSQMIRRCCTPTSAAFKDYGGRGIEVCAEWRGSYEAFRDWARANGYDVALSIDREDNDRGYEPGNCRWATAKQQAQNRRRPSSEWR